MTVRPGYLRAVVDRAELIARPDAVDTVRSAIEAAGSLHGWAAAWPDAVPLAGRGTAYRIAIGGEAWVVRHYRRGGAVAGILGDRYLRVSLPRPFHELDTSAEAIERGVRTPAVVAAVVHEAGPFYRGDIATLHVPESDDLAGVSFGATRRSRGDLLAAWRAAGELVRTAAGAGLRHADLNLKNILIAPAATGDVAWLIDLDRARLRDGPDLTGLAAMVRRLHRSRRKLEAVHGVPVGEEAVRAFDEAIGG